MQLEAPKKLALQTGFKCPVLREPIVSPCHLGNCAWNIDYEWSANCLLAYMHQQGVDQLSADEISFLYQMPIEMTRKLLDSAITALRSNAIDAHAASSTSDREFVYFITDRVCCVCESVVDEYVPKSLTIENIGAVYCSKECKDEMHPRLIELEVEKGMTISKILDWAFRNYKSLSIAENALNIPRWLAFEACRKYLDKRLEDYFPTLKSVQKQRKTMLVRRTWHAPSWVNSMIEKVRPVSRQVSRQYGPEQLHPKVLREKLDELIQNL